MVSEKFSGGAFLVVILIPLLVGMMLFIHRQYAPRRGSSRSVPAYVVEAAAREERAIVPIPGSTGRPSRPSTSPARSPSEVTRRLISDDPEAPAAMRERWEHHVPGVPLVIVESPYRALVGPLVAYLDVLDRGWPPDKPDPITFVVMPEYVARSWWERILYNQSANGCAAVAARPAEHGRRRRAVPARRPAPLPAARGGGTRAGGDAEASARRRRRRRDERAVERPTASPSGRWYRAAAPSRTRPDASLPDVSTRRLLVRGRSAAPLFRRAVLALSGSRRTGRSSRSRRSWRGSAGRARGHPCRRDRLDAAARRRRRGPLRGCPAHPRHRRDDRRGPQYRLETVLLQARDVGAAIVDEATERGADLLIAGLPFRRRFGGDFAIGRTIPYILKNAPCAVWVIREAMPEEQA